MHMFDTARLFLSIFTRLNGDIVFDVVNPFPSKGFPIDE